MKKSLKKLLAIGGTLGAASVVAGSVALSSCSVNIWKNSDGSITISDQAKPDTSTNDQNSSNTEGSETKPNTQNNSTHNVQLEEHHENKHDHGKDNHKNDNLNNQQQTTTNLQQLINEQKTDAELISQAKEHGLNISNEVSTKVSVSITKFNSLAREASDLTDNNVDSTMGQFVLTINQSDSNKSLGTISFVKANGEDTQSILATAGQNIKIKATPNANHYTLIDLEVYDASSSNTLGVTKLDDQDIYEFTLPEPTLPDGSTNPFYETGTLQIVPTFAEKQMNDFIYDFNSHAYVLNINTDNYIFDDVKHNNLQLRGTETAWAGNDKSIQYRIYLNGHDLTIENLTVPSGAQLMFINNINNNNENGKTPTVKLSDNTYMFGPDDGQYHGKITVKGVIGRFGSVQYGQRMSDYFEAHWATDIPELPKE